MKAEEEEVDIDTIVTIGGRGPSTGVSTANRSAGPGTGAVTPILIHTSGNGHALMTVDGALGKLGGGDVAMTVESDLDATWAEEDPDDDDPVIWNMKVVMESEETAGYY